MPGKEQEKEFLPQGVSVTPWKGSIPPRRSKEIKAFFFENLLLDSACAGLDFAKFGFDLGAAGRGCRRFNRIGASIEVTEKGT
jgi:hypothetical protein